MEKSEKKSSVHFKNKHTDDLIDHYWGSISYVSSLIKASEIKAGLILSFYGILLNFVYQNIALVLERFEDATVIYILLTLWFVCAVASIYYSIRCFMPRIESKYDKNIFFFGDVISKFGDIKEFSRTFFSISVDEDQLFDQLGQQIFINAKIANLKFRNVQKALKFLAIQFLMLLIIVLYYVIATFL
ncbi:Pycsar system effector family protein [Gramella sp. MAR_2010_147]|uniref:Pycsar system effector family protein n=1 Tax=Gramella sp. MAR_2010_147 TaxID=1250205 RepID=UPI00087AF106|nr:Pycsar system effector family protein [Gramella sp. MAR_2010_147]SDS13810.1 hypothetical protein SAMN04488553_1563 [Gramella sp. MAR_2010_147]